MAQARLRKDEGRKMVYWFVGLWYKPTDSAVLKTRARNKHEALAWMFTYFKQLLEAMREHGVDDPEGFEIMAIPYTHAEYNPREAKNIKWTEETLRVLKRHLGER